jgi:ribosomal protein S2
VLFCSALALLYIANAHTVEKRIRKINKLEYELKDLRSEYISLKSDLMYLSKQSEVAKRVEAAGIKELRSAPKKIYLNQ